MSAIQETWTRPEIRIKDRGRYGRRDYQRFDHIASSHIQAGRGRIGKVEVDCRFMFTKSKWGVLGEPKNPAGILYLDLDFHQPTDTKLESATVSVVLSEHDGEEKRVEHRSSCPVQFTHHFGPSLKGRETLVHTRRIVNRTPNVNVLGHGAGGLGIDKEKIVSGASRWSFTGRICSSKGSGWVYNTLQWDLKENTFEHQPTHNNLIHTAFVLEHNATRFYMTVEVSGKLVKLSDKVKNKLKFGEKEKDIVTKIEWTNGYSNSLRLDRMARELPLQMEYENMSRIPVELPETLPANYRPAITFSGSDGVQTLPSIDTTHLVGSVEEASMDTQAVGAELPQPANTPPLPATCLLDDLRIASGLVSPLPLPQENGLEMEDISDSSGSTTLANASQDPDEPSGSESNSSAEHTAVKETEDETGTQGFLHIKLSIPQWLRSVLLIVLVMLARVIGASVVEVKPKLNREMMDEGNLEKRESLKSTSRLEAAKKEQRANGDDGNFANPNPTPKSSEGTTNRGNLQLESNTERRFILLINE